MKSFLIFIRHLLDPQKRIRQDTVQHYVSGLILCGLAHLLGYSFTDSVLIVGYVGIAYEAGQTDALYSSKSPLLGSEGFGFGLLDLAADVAGAMSYVALRLVL